MSTSPTNNPNAQGGPLGPGQSIFDEVRGFAADVAKRSWQTAIGVGAVAAILGIVLLA